LTEQIWDSTLHTKNITLFHSVFDFRVVDRPCVSRFVINLQVSDSFALETQPSMGDDWCCRDEPPECLTFLDERLECFSSQSCSSTVPLHGLGLASSSGRGALKCHGEDCKCQRFVPPGGGSASYPYSAPPDMRCEHCEHQAISHGGACLSPDCGCQGLTISHSVLSRLSARVFGSKCATPGCGHQPGDHGGLRLLLQPRPQWGALLLTGAAVTVWLLPALLAAAAIVLDPDASKLRAECPNTSPGGGWLGVPRYLVVVVCWPVISGVYGSSSAKLPGPVVCMLGMFLLFGLIESLVLALNACVRHAAPLTHVTLLLHAVWWLVWMMSMCGGFKVGLTRRLGMEGCEGMEPTCRRLQCLDICEQ